MSTLQPPPSEGRDTEKDNTVKCVVWDLDDTLWHGTLLEDDHVRIRDGVAGLITTLDSRGVLQSVASRNDPDAALAQLRAFGLDEYFLFPQIGWTAKSHQIRRIADELNIGLDTILFIDDQPFEREEVAFVHASVRTADASELDAILSRPDLVPRFITDESRTRRHMYRSDIARRQAEAAFHGPSEEFLASLGMTLTIRQAEEHDLQRAEELTLRTNQLNATGYIYSYAELEEFRRSPRHKLLVAELLDHHGTYGKIGLSLLECGERVWTIKLLLMSCRVMSRGVGTVMLREIIERARAAGVQLIADFVSTDRNRMMYLTYKFAGFEEERPAGGAIMLRHAGGLPGPRPDYLAVDARF
jgi:FkbH-like protein